MGKLPVIPVIIATGFGAGFWPWGPGTAGALLAILLWMGVAQFLSPLLLIAATAAFIVVFTILGTWATARLMPYWGEDPSRVVVDEMVGVGIPLLVAACWQEAVAAFVLFRFFDIVKPLGIRALDRRKGPFWVMADDLLAGFYSAIVLSLVVWVS
jgi:phosphatidylglycerophosphatase A